MMQKSKAMTLDVNKKVSGNDANSCTSDEIEKEFERRMAKLKKKHSSEHSGDNNQNIVLSADRDLSPISTTVGQSIYPIAKGITDFKTKLHDNNKNEDLTDITTTQSSKQNLSSFAKLQANSGNVLSQKHLPSNNLGSRIEASVSKDKIKLKNNINLISDVKLTESKKRANDNLNTSSEDVKASKNKKRLENNLLANDKQMNIMSNNQPYADTQQFDELLAQQQSGNDARLSTPLSNNSFAEKANENKILAHYSFNSWQGKHEVNIALDTKNSTNENLYVLTPSSATAEHAISQHLNDNSCMPSIQIAGQFLSDEAEQQKNNQQQQRDQQQQEQDESDEFVIESLNNKMENSE